jgi:hypothetical protein
MDRTASTIVVIVVILLALLGMLLGWRARRRRQSSVPPPPAVPTSLGTPSYSGEVFYVATTIANEPLDRVNAKGLGFRGRATVTVVPEGVVLGIAGTPGSFIPASTIRSVDRATWTIDRVVERNGLVVIAWTLGETDVDSYLRVAEPADPIPLIDAVTALIGSTAGKATT